MANALTDNGVELYNITTGNGAKTEFFSDEKIKEWVMPGCKLSKDFLPPQSVISEIQSIITEVNPQIIHIWGLEGFWSRLSWKGYITGPVLLEMQGLMSSCAEVFYGGLSLKEKIACYRLKELISYKRSLPYERRLFTIKGEQEPAILHHHKYISTQSDWVRSRIMPLISNDCHVYNTDIAVRKCFAESNRWRVTDCDKKTLLSVASGATPYKGLHVAIKALKIVKERYNDVEFRIVGDYSQNSASWRKSGYVKYLEKLINKLGLKKNVVFLGPLTAEEIVEELHKTNVFIQSSFVESYSLTVAEALTVGVPSVISYAGAMPELAKDGETGLFYNPTDYFKCAYQIMKILNDDKLSEILSLSAINYSRTRHSLGRVFDIQINIYNDFLTDYYKNE